MSAPGKDGTPPQFTDYGLVAIGAPRNSRVPANKDPNFFDLGLCGPLRSDLRDRAEYCGRFKTPSLRNVATRQVFFHNGVFHTLRQVMEFYVQRDTNPEKWYSRDRTGACANSTTCPQSTMPMSMLTRPSAGTRATGRHCPIMRSTMSSLSCGP